MCVPVCGYAHVSADAGGVMSEPRKLELEVFVRH